MSYACEEFLKHILFDTSRPIFQNKTLYECAAELKGKYGNDNQGIAKAIVLLQTFIIYLTYRSNGSPRKLIKAIQEFILIEDPEKISDEESLSILVRHTKIEFIKM